MLEPFASPWVWTGFVGLMLAVCGTGFVAGVTCAPALQEWWLKRSARRLERLHAWLVEELDRVERLCQQISALPAGTYNDHDWRRLEQGRARFLDAWRAAAEQHATTAAGAVAPKTPPAPLPKAFDVAWSVPVQTVGDRAAFDLNQSVLIEATTAHGSTSGLLLVRIDKLDHLVKRFGEVIVDRLRDQVTAIVRQSIRSQDLLCRLDDDTLAVLIPSVSPIAGARCAEAVRAAVRLHPFRAGDNGPELLVTASFGYGTYLPGEMTSLAFDRAHEALGKSQSAGRNQLHVHDVTHRTVCRVS